MSKAKTKPSKKLTVKTLDEETSARVLAEFIALDGVTEGDIDTILEGAKRSLTHREIAITFRIGDVLKIPDCFAMAPRFAVGFKVIRKVWHHMTEATL